MKIQNKLENLNCCIICTNETSKFQKNYKCNHKICVKCVDKWKNQSEQIYNNQCPCCRTNNKNQVQITNDNSQINVEVVPISLENIEIPIYRSMPGRDTPSRNSSQFNHDNFDNECRKMTCGIISCVSSILICIVVFVGFIYSFS